VARVVPWTARLIRGGEVTYRGASWQLEALVAERRDELVLKQTYDIRGDGVTVGRAVSLDAWSDALTSAWGTGAVVQRYVPPTRHPVRRLGCGPAAELNTSLDSFIVDGELVGLGAKASPNDKVNLFQGGSKLAVFVGDDA
jgi:hypothetical protein